MSDHAAPNPAPRPRDGATAAFLEEPRRRRAPLAARLADNVRRVLLGKDETIRLALAALIADGHLLLEDVPGTGKTMLARALARSIDAKFARIQFTPDLLPSDVTGISIFNEATRGFEFRPGPVFCQILLADELNRATPRAQAALLECMAERTVTADGATRQLDELFLVVATQNPIEQHGVYALPEAQLDRFLFKLSVGYPGEEREIEMLAAQRTRHPIEEIGPVATRDEILAARTEARAIHVDPDLARYIVRIVEATRAHEDALLGGSPRASLAIYRSAQALAWMEGRTFVLPDDVKAVAPPALRHRISLKPQARISGLSPDAVVDDVLRDIQPPIGR